MTDPSPRAAVVASLASTLSRAVALGARWRPGSRFWASSILQIRGSMNSSSIEIFDDESSPPSRVGTKA
ncbi:hypothetical protein WMF04_23855 [Sorangium sp. So ce260]|uniref:hypothetical protein n=1 Tax=Sorangium sp. So ce260 TaxID=3133291 RepID=UPI003F5F69B2